MAEFIASFCGVGADGNGNIILSFTAKNQQREIKKAINDLKGWSAAGKHQLNLDVKPYRKKRSLDANAYFHVLVHKIAQKLEMGEQETKTKLVLDYGTIMRDETGAKVGLKIPSTVDINNIYKYAKRFDVRNENGIEFNCYIIYKQTHTLDSKEMARLIQGAVNEAEQLDIEVRTPDEIARMLSLWEHKKE